MTSITSAQAAAHAHLEAMTGRPGTVCPNNETVNATTSRFEVYDGPADPSWVSQDGAALIEQILQIDVVVESGMRTNQMQGLVQNVLDAFAFGTDFGKATVTRVPVPQAYRVDGTDYRCSISIHYSVII